MTDYVRLIEVKRDGREHTAVELQALVQGFMEGGMADYQMSAWLMAVVLRGMTYAETLALTDLTVASGSRLDLDVLGRQVVDKHSTGGVGDKVTLVLAPVVAACGAVFGKMSGRGLGHTGGTIDKLESIPGFRATIEPRDFIAQLRETGICVAGQSAAMVPVEKRLYALRDVTGTVASNPLIAASIMSKKIAAGAGMVVMDIKVGRGAFFQNRGQAAGVYHLMREIGAERGVRVMGIMSPMDQPLGHAVGNSLEVLEAVEALKGRGPHDLVAVAKRLAVIALEASDAGFEGEGAAAAVEDCLSGGAALEKFREWITAQGGDIRFIDEPERLPAAGFKIPVTAKRGGYVSLVDALAVGRAMPGLGAGRQRHDDVIDHTAGAIIFAKAGDEVAAGDRIAEVRAADRDRGLEAAAKIAAAYEFSREKPQAQWRITDL